MARLFVTTYGLYNEGRQFQSDKTGFWFDVEDKELYELVDHFVDNELDEDPELMFTDFEDFPKELYGESLSEKCYAKIKEYSELEDTEKEGYEFLVDHMGYDHSLAMMKCDDVHFDDQSPKDYAYDFIDEVYPEVSDWVKGHLDYESIANELIMSNEIIEWNGKLVIGAEGI